MFQTDNNDHKMGKRMTYHFIVMHKLVCESTITIYTIRDIDFDWDVRNIAKI